LRNKKLVITTVIFIIVFLFSQAYAAGKSGVEIMVNGKKLNTEVKIIDNKAYVPLNDTFKGLGASVVSRNSGNTISIELPESDDRVPNILKKLSTSVVGVVGNQKDGQNSNLDQKYIENIIHGTGVIIKSTGEILTNAHVVKDMDKIVVILSDGTGYEAVLKCIDENADLALIKIPKTKLSPVVFGNDSDVVIGKTVIAIGTPISLSLMNSATVGVISGLNRGSENFYRLIQTDAAINPGNSGGPLVNMDGKVIGINSSKYVGVGIEGIGFSIPINTINYVLKQFNLNGKVKRPYLGADFEEDWIAHLGLPSSNGLKIIDINNNSPAIKAGLKIDDMFISINNKKINTIVDFNEEMKKYIPGNTVNIGIKRAGVYQNKTIKLGENE
jgi:serine protease Do